MREEAYQQTQAILEAEWERYLLRCCLVVLCILVQAAWTLQSTIMLRTRSGWHSSCSRERSRSSSTTNTAHRLRNKNPAPVWWRRGKTYGGTLCVTMYIYSLTSLCFSQRRVRRLCNVEHSVDCRESFFRLLLELCYVFLILHLLWEHALYCCIERALYSERLVDHLYTKGEDRIELYLCKL